MTTIALIQTVISLLRFVFEWPCDHLDFFRGDMILWRLMNYKYVLVLILFIFNFSATVVVESSHIELPTVESQHNDHPSHAYDEKFSDHSEKDQHCSDHDCCHLGHVHVYLMTMKSINFGTQRFSFLSFASFIQASNTAFPEIIKPPLV